MAKETAGYEKFHHANILRKFTGEFLSDRAKGLYLLIPKVSFWFSFFLFLSAVFISSAGLIKTLFFITNFFLLVSIVFIYMMIEERANIPALGVINEARRLQFKFFSKKKIKYYALLGAAVWHFLGGDAKEAIEKNLGKRNLKYQVLIDKDVYTQGYLNPGSTGSGKTSAVIATIFIPAVQTGAGIWYIEGKGDKPITEAAMALIYMHGREFDVFILDFGAAASGGRTNGLNPLAIGNAKTVGELLKNLIDIMKGDNKWVSDMAIAFLEAMLIPLVLMRDLKIVINPAELASVSTFKDLEAKEKFEFNITSLLKYLNFQAAIDLYYMMNRLYKDDEFIRAIKTHDSYSSLQKGYAENFTDRLGRNLTTHNIDIASVVAPIYAKLPSDIKKNHPKATEDWINALEVFGSEMFYGKIFNKDNADFDALTAIQTAKIIITILPSLSASDDMNRKIGQMMTAISKSAIGYMIEQGDLEGTRREKRKDKRYRPRGVPYALVYDEPGNFASSDISQSSSMVRSIGTDGGGFAICWAGQSKSDADRIDDDKKIESQRLLANMALTHCLNIQDGEGWNKYLHEKLGKHYIWYEDQFEGPRNNESVEYRTLKKELVYKYEPNYFEDKLRPKTGEAIVKIKGFENEEKMITQYIEAPSSDLKIANNISFKQLMATFKTDEEIEQELLELEKRAQKEIDDKINFEDGIAQTYTEEVKSALIELANYAFPALPKADEFTLKLLERSNPRAHGDYTFATHHINIYNAINKPKEHLVATAIHELTHHVELLLTGDTGHSKHFYKLLHELLGKAMELKLIDYDEAKAQKSIDSADIKLLEKYFGRPFVRNVENSA